jgi:hypothetical protein
MFDREEKKFYIFWRGVNIFNLLQYYNNPVFEITISNYSTQKTVTNKDELTRNLRN